MTEPVRVRVRVGLPDEEPDHLHTQRSLIPGDPGEFERQRQGVLWDLGKPARQERPRADQAELF